jgi:hypothetical protein
MKVSELIEKLQAMPQDYDVVIRQGEGRDGCFSDWEMSNPWENFGQVVLYKRERTEPINSVG